MKALTRDIHLRNKSIIGEFKYRGGDFGDIAIILTLIVRLSAASG
jgi:hypothetical protein